jgi:hypothetical protein
MRLKDTKDYKSILTLPSYEVLEHPTTFHVVIVHKNKPKRDSPTTATIVGEAKLPGLSNDPDIAIPAGMFREVVKQIKKPSISRGVIPEPNWGDRVVHNQVPLARNPFRVPGEVPMEELAVGGLAAGVPPEEPDLPGLQQAAEMVQRRVRVLMDRPFFRAPVPDRDRPEEED